MGRRRSQSNSTTSRTPANDKTVSLADRPLAALKNIGEKTAPWLISVGITSEAALCQVGAAEAFRRLKAAFPNKVTWLALYALHGALHDTHWNDFPAELKQQMREEVLRRERS